MTEEPQDTQEYDVEKEEDRVPVEQGNDPTDPEEGVVEEDEPDDWKEEEGE